MSTARINELREIQASAFNEDIERSSKLSLPGKRRDKLLVGDILFVKRKLWKNAGGFSDNPAKKGHPGLVTIPSPKASSTVMMVPGTSKEPKGHFYFFCPKGKINYTRKHFRGKSTSFVLDYWRPVSKNGPYKIGNLSNSDKLSLENKMIEVHRDQFIQIAYGEG